MQQINSDIVARTIFFVISVSIRRFSTDYTEQSVKSVAASDNKLTRCASRMLTGNE
jgi:hypothetical protein